MAIKGKKRKRSRPTSRRPAAAPRPVLAPGRKPPWYTTPQGRVIAGIVVAAVVIVGLVAFKNARADQAALEQSQEDLEQLTGDVDAMLQTIAGPASEMLITQEDSKDLAKDAESWIKVFKDAQKEFTSNISLSTAELDVPNRLFSQALLQYEAAAETYALVPGADKKLRSDLIERAAAQVTAADGTWGAGVASLDEKREAAELDPSRLGTPSSSAAPTGPGDGSQLITPGG